MIPAAILVLLLASCRGERAETVSSPTPASSPSSSQLTSVAEQNDVVTIRFTEDGAEHKLVGENRNGKRKYALDGGAVLYEVKPGDDDSFKLRAPDGALRWKVKVKPDKIKVSNNEQNENAFELKPKDADRVKVVAPGDRELGNVRYKQNRIEVENAGGREVFKTDAPKFSGAYGVMLMDGIPDRERYILIAEILSRGR